MYKILSYEPKNSCLGTIILMTGRNGRAIDLLKYYEKFCELEKTRLISIEPIDEWYPIPYSPENQQEAIMGLKVSIPQFNKLVSKIEKKFKIDRSKIVLAGFSAGAVMAIQVAAHSDKPFAAVISHNGAILAPDELPKSKHKTPILLIHSKNDECFSWEERYLPMKKVLFEKEYTVEFCEKEYGNHFINPEDIADAAIFLADILEYPQEWTHSFQYKHQDDLNQFEYDGMYDANQIHDIHDTSTEDYVP